MKNKGYLKVVGELIAESTMQRRHLWTEFGIEVIDYESIQGQLKVGYRVHLSTMIPKKMTDLFYD